MESDKLWSQPLQEVFLTQFRWYFSKSFHESEDLSINICLPQEDYTEYMPSVFWKIRNAALWSPEGEFCGYLKLCDLFISSPPIFCVMFCSIAVYVTPEQLISQSISLSASGGESYEAHRSVCRNQKCRIVITLGGVLVHYHQDLASRPMSVSPPLSPHFPPPVLSSRTSVRYFPVVLMPMSAGCAGSVPRIRDALINISSPGPGGETQAAHNPYCSVN